MELLNMDSLDDLIVANMPSQRYYLIYVGIHKQDSQNGYDYQWPTEIENILAILR
jgi:hypothetical protein